MNDDTLLTEAAAGVRITWIELRSISQDKRAEVFQA